MTGRDTDKAGEKESEKHGDTRRVSALRDEETQRDR